MDASNMVRAGRRGRWAVAALFFMNGFLTGSWAPQIPVFVERLEISELTLGLLILLFGVGAITAMPTSGYLMSHHGSRVVLRVFSILAAFGLLFVVGAWNVPLAAIAMFLFGGVIGGMDVSMNANAVAVERTISRAIMSSSHAFWSLGGFIGGGAGGYFIQTYGALSHAVVVTAISLTFFALATRSIVADPPVARASNHKRTLPKSRTIYLLGIMALFTMVPEGSVLDWAALYLQQERGSDLATAGLAYGLFAGAMAFMRFIGDGVRNRFGAVRTLTVSSLVGAAGMLVAGLSPSPWLAIAAFAVSGLGIANIIPIIFSAAGNQPGMASATGMSVVTTMGYSGILLAPSAIGFAAEHTGFQIVFVALAGLLVIVCLMGRLAASADFKHSS
ncbi:MFS transporter [Pseudaminobacter sp. 19-2017]|uniref:MFS transporter n=1 Tax=Pseudaminobacter soli (ex Zhang et al. 2022) TaxID=2831468 RepID=A0A942DVS7_9HYPH|nr:MFS transporter [Pseudaminobacter soli]MBS3647698.1 MFS transporter [Pseudaminobacter soli]